MIGYFDYTVILTYLSLLSAVCGIAFSMLGQGHPYIGCFFLLFSGFCDAFDGKVARHKANRTQSEKCFGVQIDSLSDLVAFGVLPGTIAIGLFMSGGRRFAMRTEEGTIYFYAVIFFIAVLFYVLAAMIRLAYFNMLESEHRDTDAEGNKQFIGLPVTTAALIFPLILLLNYLTIRDFSLLYFVALPVMGLLFLSRIHIRKPSFKMLLVLLGIGAAEFVLLLLFLLRAGGR